jgi:hypothetical protein
MQTQVTRAILIGLLSGVLLFFMPFFLLRVVFIFLLIGLIFRLSGFRRRWYGDHGGRGFWSNPEYARRWHNMSNEERNAFKQKMEKELFANP